MSPASNDPRVPRTLFFADCIGVFQGGGCRAAAHVGAYAAARSRGVHFFELAGTSAGAIVAVLVAAGAEPDWLRDKVASLDFKKFMQPASGPTSQRVPKPAQWLARGPVRQALTLWQHQALYSGSEIATWVEAALRELLGNAASRPSVLFRDLPLAVSVMAADLRSGLPKTFGSETTPDESVAKAVQASCTLPFFFQAVDGLVDGGLLSNLPVHLIEVDSWEPSRILAFALEDSSPSAQPQSLKEFTSAIATTVVRGSQKVQEKGLQSNVSVVRINTGDTGATDFDKMDDREARRLIGVGEAATNDFLDVENLEPGAEHPRRTFHEAQTYDVLAHRLLSAQHLVQIATSDTTWSAELFAALWLARSRRVQVEVTVTSSPSSKPSAIYQRELLSALGCSVQVRQPGHDVPVDAWLFDPGTAAAVAVVPTTHGSLEATVHTAHSGEGGVLSLLQAALASEGPSGVSAAAGLGLSQASEGDVIQALRPVPQYVQSAEISVEEVELDRIDAWAKYALSYKQRQQEVAARVFREHQLEAFRPAWLSLSEGRRTLLLPPVVEASRGGQTFTLVNGASRLVLLEREGRRTAWCAVVRHVAEPAPAETVRPVRQLPVRIGRKGDPKHRYDNFRFGHVRSVERFAHTSEALEASRRSGGETG